MVFRTLKYAALAIVMAGSAYGCGSVNGDKNIHQLDGSVQLGDLDPSNRDGGTPDGGLEECSINNIFEKLQADTYDDLEGQLLSNGDRLGDVFYSANVTVSSDKFDSLFYADGSPVRDAMEQDIIALLPACNTVSVSGNISDFIAGRQSETEGFIPAEHNAVYAKDSGNSTIFCIKGEEEDKLTAYCSTTLPLGTRAVITYGGGI